MGARWAWEAICYNGHQYGNFSGGADECYTCGEGPEHVFDGDDCLEQIAAWYKEQKATVEERMEHFL